MPHATWAKASRSAEIGGGAVGGSGWAKASRSASTAMSSAGGGGAGGLKRRQSAARVALYIARGLKCVHIGHHHAVHRCWPQPEDQRGEQEREGARGGEQERERAGKRRRAEKAGWAMSIRARQSANAAVEQTQARHNVQGRRRSACALARQNRQAKKHGRLVVDEGGGLPHRRRDVGAHGAARANRQHNEDHFGLAFRGSRPRRSRAPCRRSGSRGATP